jgi:excisionase family DNA binding protein
MKRMSNTQHVQPRYITVKQAAKRLAIGTTKCRELIAYEQLPVVRFGRAVRINPIQLEEWCAKREASQSV